MKNPLISTDSSLYLRRLARELNSQSDGFYISATGTRCTCARYSKGVLQIKRLAHYLDPRDARNGRAVWFDAEGMTFTDTYGRAICASRSAI
jgi:hypothetical protein